MKAHPSIDTVVSEVNKEVMDGIRRTVDPLVHLVKDAHEKYTILEQVLQGMPLFADLRTERDLLRAQLDKHEANIVMTVQDTSPPRVQPVASEVCAPPGLAQFVQASIEAEDSPEAKKAFHSVLAFLGDDADTDGLGGAHMYLSGSEDRTSPMFGSYELESDRSMDAITRSVAEEVESRGSAFTSLGSALAAAPTSSTRSPARSPASLSDVEVDLSQEEESAGEADLIPYDGLVDEEDNPIECFADDPENGTLYEKVGDAYEEIGQLHDGEVSFNE